MNLRNVMYTMLVLLCIVETLEYVEGIEEDQSAEITTAPELLDFESNIDVSHDEMEKECESDQSPIGKFQFHYTVLSM